MKLNVNVCSLMAPVAMMTLLAIGCAERGKGGAEGGSSAAVASTESATSLWQADLGNGHYRNPILYADYSDPDVVAVGDEFYMTASSFNASPGLPLLHSTDLVNWELIDYVVDKNVPAETFAKPQHGNGIWAPNIRYHDDKLWIFFPDPDHGIYMTNTTDPKQGWSEPKLILPGKGIIDPTPMWDDDGQAYLLHGWAKSRSGKNNILTLHKMSADGTQVEAEGEVVINGHELEGYRTLEGPKFYKRGEYYYVFAPAGGVPVGWQSVFRSKNIYGPYEDRIVMEQGDSITNGPHQGSWVHTPAGEDWFIHFQARGPYGRIVHLQPMQWKDGWPVIGVDEDGDGVGNPVTSYRKPEVSKPSPVKTLPFADDFSSDELAQQWQWNANYEEDWFSLSEREGYLRLFAQQNVDPENDNLWMQPSLLLQKLPAPEFILQTTLEIPESLGEAEGGLLMFGEDYAWIGFRNLPGTGEVEIGEVSCRDARKGCTEHFQPHTRIQSGELTLRMTVSQGGQTVLSYQKKNGRFRALGELFQSRRGRWVGAKVGLFIRTEHEGQVHAENYIDVKEFRFIPPVG
ncbi:glycoside hydrolase 43 family protein [Microbulbifer mangrovi]|uniref:glycoside hydrolase family 43 protein n=1 Tax=Microbulbifer mangrovi TaxID=927787 RepID=UPI0009904D64|nr:glycoside hydrolase 43 family protein [Microbulbifer mangrovi]